MSNKNFKNSGVDWIGNFPNDWTVKRIKDVCVNLGGGNYGEDEGNPGYLIPCISISDFKNGDLFNTYNIKMNRVYKKKNILKKGAILIEKSGGGEKVPVGRSIYLINDLEAYYTNFVQGIKVIGNDSKFVNYCFQVIHKNRLHMDSVKQTTGLQNFEFNKFSNYFQIPTPSKEQQTKIVTFLDTETSKIDRKISLLEQKYDKLEEYKQSVIFETVTKGLDKNVELKDSGIDWIGEIPKHWDIVRLKDFSVIKKGESFDEKLASVDGVYPYINGGINPSDWSNHFNTKENTIAVSEGGASAGYTQFMTTKYWAGSHCYKIQSKNKKSDNKYLFYVLKGFEKYLMIEKTGSAMPNLQKTKFINYLVSFVNNIEEQNKIVDYLDTFTSKIDKKVEIIKKQIELLKEYKQTIIYEAVTGKMEIL